MNRIVMVTLLSAAMIFVGMMTFIDRSVAGKSGEAQFKQYCQMCHPNGGNIINKKKTLDRKSLQANNIKTESDIIKTMRNPGPGMTRFDEKTIPEDDAKAIAQYILKTFK